MHSTAYTGHIALLFAEGTGVRLVDGHLTSRTGVNMAPIETALELASGVRIRRGLPTISDEKLPRPARSLRVLGNR